MSMGEIIGSIIGGLALISGIIWRFVTKLHSLQDAVQLLAIQVERIKTKVEDIWLIFLEEGRSRRSDMRESPKLSEKGKELVPEDIRQAIACYRKECYNDCEIAGHEIVSLIIKSLGIERLSADAKDRDLSLQEYVAVLADYYE